MRSSLLLLVLSVFCAVALAAPAAPKVRVDFYEEALCPNCQDFIKQTLNPSMDFVGFAEMVDLNVVPWGNAYYNITQCASPSYIRDNYYCWVKYCAPGVANPPKDCFDATSAVIQCQHGAGECTGNDVEMCVVNKYTDAKQVTDFLYCYEIQKSAMQQCAAATGMDYGYITSCLNDKSKVASLQQFYANQTAALGAAKQGVPWVVINGKVLDNDNDFVPTICNAYTGSPKPLICSNAAVPNAKAMVKYNPFPVAERAAVKEGAITVCSIIGSHLPSECQCQDDPTAPRSIVTCGLSLFNIDNLTTILTLEPCANPADLSIEVKEADLNLDKTFGPYTTGDSFSIAIPGLSFDIPIVGEAGAVLDVNLSGNAASFTVQIGIDACIEILGHKECGDKVTSKLPFWFLNKTFDFGSLCTMYKNKN